MGIIPFPLQYGIIQKLVVIEVLKYIYHNIFSERFIIIYGFFIKKYTYLNIFRSL
jgi:hypothetical protein